MISDTNWGALLALFVFASIVESAFWSQMNVFSPIYLPRLGVAPEDVKTWTGALGAISGLIGLPFLPFWGALADRYARQPVIVRSFVVHMIAGVLAVLAGNIWVFLLARSVQSLSLGNSGLMMTTLVERAPSNRTGFAFATMGAASPLGSFLGPLAGGPVVDRYGFAALMVIDVALMLVVVLSMAFAYRDSYRGTQSTPLLRMAGESMLIIGRSPRLRALFPAMFLLNAGWMLAFSYIALVIALVNKGPASDLGTVTGVVVGAGGLSTIVLSPLLGALADRFGHWRVLFIAATVAVLLWPLPLLTTDIVPFAIVWAAINGMSSAVFAISFSVLSASAAPGVRGRVMSFAYLPVNVGFIMGAGLGSIVTQSGLFTIFPVAAVLMALGVLAMLFASRQKVGAEQQSALPESATAS